MSSSLKRPDKCVPTCHSQSGQTGIGIPNLSFEPDTIFSSLLKNATEVTLSVWPINGPRIVNPDSASQTRRVLSFEPDTNLSSSENAKQVT
jgi:hypothetical protein